MPSKSPSKYLSLKYLVSIAESDFCNRDKGIDYVDAEVMDLIYQKQRERSEKHLRKTLAEYDRHDIAKRKVTKLKYCSRCKTELGFKEFHVDKSKKHFGRRSHCKGCRSTPF